MRKGDLTRLRAVNEARAAAPNAVLDSLLSLVNDHDAYTGDHSCRVAHMATTIAEYMALDKKAVDLVTRAATVHDVGKIGVPVDILQKTTALTKDELVLVRLHPILGAGIVSRVAGMEPLVPIVLHHHERWDGKGYPYGLAGAEIPLEARIIFVCDAFDAMTTERPYGHIFTVEEAIDELQAWVGEQFDRIPVEALTAAHRDGVLLPSPTRLAHPHSA